MLFFQFRHDEHVNRHCSRDISVDRLPSPGEIEDMLRQPEEIMDRVDEGKKKINI
jgi:hypothetical protein